MYNTSIAAKMFHFYFSVYCEANIFNHLACAHFNGKHPFYLVSQSAKFFFRKRK